MIITVSCRFDVVNDGVSVEEELWSPKKAEVNRVYVPNLVPLH